MDSSDWLADARNSYDTVAVGYADRMRSALDGAPYVRAVLTLFAELVGQAGGGDVADLGCGPGQVTAYLRDLGVQAFGIDISPAMIEVARRDHPDLGFSVGSMTELELADGSVGGVVSFWSLVHTPDDAMPAVVAEFRRVLRPGGLLLLGFHLGDRATLKTEGYGGHPMNVFVYRRPMSRMEAWLQDAGFTVQGRMEMALDSDLPGAMIIARATE